MAGKPTFTFRNHMKGIVELFAAARKAMLAKDKTSTGAKEPKMLPKHNSPRYRHQGFRECNRRCEQMAKGWTLVQGVRS